MWEIIIWGAKNTFLVRKSFSERFGKKAEIGLREHEAKSQKRIIRLSFLKLNFVVVSEKVVVNISQEGSVVEGVVPTPGRETFVVILTIEMKTFYVLFDDFDEVNTVFLVVNIKSAFVVVANALDYLVILNFKLF